MLAVVVPPFKFASPCSSRAAQRSAASCRPRVNDPGPHTKCKYLHVRAAVSEVGEYSLFQVIAPIYHGDVLPATLAIRYPAIGRYFSQPFSADLSTRGFAIVQTICV